MKTLILTITLAACATIVAFSQGKKSVVIGTMIDRPNAVLVINPPNKDQGFLLPQLTSTERLAITPSSPQDDGLVVYDTTDKSFYYWSGGSWVKGLGDNTNRSLSYDPATQNLSLSGGGGSINLSTLKEVPSMTGQAGKYLTTDGTTLTWTTLGTMGDITSIITGQGLTGGATSGDISLSVNTDGTTISVNGSNQLQLSDNAVTSTKIAGNAVNGSHIIDGSITSTEILDNTITTADLAPSSVTGPKVANNSITTAHITSGGNNKVLTTDGTGAVSWADRATFVDDNQNLTLAGNTVNIDDGTGVNLNNITTAGDVAGALNAQVIQPGAVNSSKILDGSVATTDLTSGGVNKVMTTDGSGVVSWADRSTFTDNQNLSLTGSTLNIDNGTGVNINASGQVTGPLDDLDIAPGASNQVMTTNAAGTAAVWSTPAGDVTGPVSGSTVARIQGRDVTNTAPALNDALIWNGTAWAPGNAVVAVAPVTEYYAIDPSAFQGLEPSGGTDQTVTGLYEADNTFISANQTGTEVMAPVNLPHNATIQRITVYYLNEDLLLLGPIIVRFYRKNFTATANQQLTTLTIPYNLLAPGNQNVDLPGIPPANAVVDNSTFTYRIHVIFADSADGPGDATQRIYGVKIEYTK